MYRTDTEAIYKPGYRTELDKRKGAYFLVQVHIDSPHVEVWRSLPFPSADAARRRRLELEAMEYKAAGRNPIEACSNLSYIAFSIHWNRVEQEGHPSGALIDCPDCYKAAEKAIRAAAEELDWIKEVISEED